MKHIWNLKCIKKKKPEKESSETTKDFFLHIWAEKINTKEEEKIV